MSRSSDDKPTGWLSSIRGLFGGKDDSNNRKRTVDRTFEEDKAVERRNDHPRRDQLDEPMGSPLPKQMKRTNDANLYLTSTPIRALPEKAGNASFSFASSTTKTTADDGPSSTSFVELYPSKDANVLDLRTKILTPASKTRMLYNQLDRISTAGRASGSPKLPTLPSLDGWQNERWARTPTQDPTGSPVGARKSLFAPSRLHEISVHLAKSTNKPYWRPLGMQPRMTSTPVDREERDTEPLRKQQDAIVLDDTPDRPSTSKATKTAGSEQALAANSRTPVLKGITGRNVAPSLKTNVFHVSDDDLLMTPTVREDESALSKIKPLDFGRLPRAGFLSSASDDGTFAFAAPVLRDAKAPPKVLTRSFEKESSPESVVTDHEDSESEAPAEGKKTTPYDSETSDDSGDASKSVTPAPPKEKPSAKETVTNGAFRTSSPEIRITPAEKETEKPEETGARSPKLLQPPPPFGTSVKAVEAKDKVEVPAAAIPAGKKWECPTCWVKNEDLKDACVCCQTPKPRAKEATKDKAASADAKWKCPECWVDNKATDETCPCCQTPKPGAKPAENGTQPKPSGPAFKPATFAPAPSGGFQFGVSKTTDEPKSTAASAISFGTTKPAQAATGLSFGLSAAAQPTTTAPVTASSLSFGFGAATTTTAAATSTAALTTTTSASGQPAFPLPKTTTAAPGIGSVFGAPAAGSIFGFGAQKPEEKKPDAPAALPSLTFGKPAVPAVSSALPAATSAATQSSFSLPSAATTSAAPLFGAGSTGSLFAFGAAASTSVTTTATSTAPSFSSPFGSLTSGTAPFAFGAKPAELAVSSAAPAAAALSFGATAPANAMNGVAASDAPATKRAHVFAFGGQQPQANGLPGSSSAPNLAAFGVPVAPAFGSQAGSAQQGFNFGAPAAPASTGFNFGAAAGTTAPSFNFGAPAANGGSTFQFGAAAPPAQNGTTGASSTFQFGATPAVPAFGAAPGADNPLAASAVNPFAAGGASSSSAAGRKILRARTRVRK